MELKTLVNRAKGGDCDAFAEAFESYRELLYRIACRMVGHSDADDVVMETYLKAWRSIPKFRGEAALKNWLIRILRSCATDLLRKQSREEARTMRPAIDGEEGAQGIDRLPDEGILPPDRKAEIDDLGEHIQLALRDLSDDHRAAILLREVDGLSYREIAQATGVGIGTVMSRLFYAKKHLRQALAKMGFGR
jgi:RNA polymerase sigma-70 factor (ECF subfamily)